MGAEAGNSGGIIVLFLFMLVALAYGLWCCTRILARTGHSRAWAFLMIVPVVNLALVWVFAFARWPRLDANRAQARPLAARAAFPILRGFQGKGNRPCPPQNP